MNTSETHTALAQAEREMLDALAWRAFYERMADSPHVDSPAFKWRRWNSRANELQTELDWLYAQMPETTPVPVPVRIVVPYVPMAAAPARLLAGVVAPSEPVLSVGATALQRRLQARI